MASAPGELPFKTSQNLQGGLAISHVELVRQWRGSGSAEGIFA